MTNKQPWRNRWIVKLQRLNWRAMGWVRKKKRQVTEKIGELDRQALLDQNRE